MLRVVVRARRERLRFDVEERKKCARALGPNQGIKRSAAASTAIFKFNTLTFQRRPGPLCRPKIDRKRGWRGGERCCIERLTAGSRLPLY